MTFDTDTNDKLNVMSHKLKMWNLKNKWSCLSVDTQHKNEKTRQLAAAQLQQLTHEYSQLTTYLASIRLESMAEPALRLLLCVPAFATECFYVAPCIECSSIYFATTEKPVLSRGIDKAESLEKVKVCYLVVGGFNHVRYLCWDSKPKAASL